MALIVQKFGGTSVGTLERIGRAAERAAATAKAGHRVVVVVSAMAGETNRLLKLAHDIAEVPDLAEVDVLIATGEQASAAMMSMQLIARGHPARSFLGHQIAIHTNSSYGRAWIESIDRQPILEALDRGEIVIVAGFQGIDAGNRLTTLGRGGSDTTAVALAAALGADYCDIFTDVDGVYTSDPNVVPDARRIPHLTHEEMLEMASLGAKVLAERSVEYAMRYNVSVRVLHAFQDGEGTLVDGREDEMEQRTVTAVTCQRDQAKIAFRGVPDRPGIAASIFAPLSEAGVVVDMIVQNVSEHGLTDLTFTVPRVDLKRLLPAIEEVARGVQARQVDHDSTIAKVSVIGVGMRTHAGVAARMFQALSAVGVNMQMISTSEIKISCVIEDKFSELAVRVLHEAFELGKKTAPSGKASAAKSKKKPAPRKRARA